MQFVAPTWTGRESVRRMIIETEGSRISRVAPEGTLAVEASAHVFGDDTLLVPGFHDAHGHLLMGGLRLSDCDFDGVRTVDEFSDVLSEYLSKNNLEKGAWIQGWGLDETRVRIDRKIVDKVCADIPVFIRTHDLHSAVVNSAALIRARIDGNVKNPEGGRFERDSSGVLNGILRESAAHAVQNAIPEPTQVRARTALLKAQDYAFSLGITAVSCSARADELPRYLEFANDSLRKVRINAWKVSEGLDFEWDRFERIESDGFRLRTLKGFTDGALGSRTAAFWKPYEDDPKNNGMLLVREGALARWIRAAHGEEFQVALHAIGDRANSACLDAFEMAGSAGRGPEFRPRIEHVQHLRERDLTRFAELGVIASMQPIHCTADMRFVEPRLGKERSRFSYAWRSLLDHGATLAFGSDWPIEDFNPLAGIHAAVTRQTADGEPQNGWQLQERISAEEALRAYTMGGAYAAFWEKDLGTIEEGKAADLAILSRNILSCSPREILNTRVLMTVADGEVVFSADSSM